MAHGLAVSTRLSPGVSGPGVEHKVIGVVNPAVLMTPPPRCRRDRRESIRTANDADIGTVSGGQHAGSASTRPVGQAGEDPVCFRPGVGGEVDSVGSAEGLTVAHFDVPDAADLDAVAVWSAEVVSGLTGGGVEGRDGAVTEVGDQKGAAVRAESARGRFGDSPGCVEVASAVPSRDQAALGGELGQAALPGGGFLTAVAPGRATAAGARWPGLPAERCRAGGDVRPSAIVAGPLAAAAWCGGRVMVVAGVRRGR